MGQKSIRVEALKTLWSERTAMRITKAGYTRCKRALKQIGFSDVEQAEALDSLEFRGLLLDDPEYNKDGILIAAGVGSA